MGHVQYIRGRLFAWLLDVKDPRFIVGYSGTELDIALERGEVDARAATLDMRALTESYQNLVDFHAILENPKGQRPGGPGRLSSRGSHRPVRAFLMHTVPQVMDLLRDSILSGPPAPAGAGTALTAG